MPSVLIIGHVWPEPRSSAAGLRDQNLIDFFKEEGWDVTFCSPAKESPYQDFITRQGVSTQVFAPNDSAFDEFVNRLKPDFCLFDRFMMEEQFGWRVREASPSTVRILDTIDLHFLRRARGEALKKDASIAELASPDFAFDRYMEGHETALREVASLFRSDLTLVLSPFELELLTSKLGVPASLLHLLALGYAEPTQPPRSFAERAHFSVIGNFRHPPNQDGFQWLHRELWPQIRERLPRAEVHIYGAYPPREMMSLTDEATGFYVKGSAEDQFEVLSRYRVNLAPLRFGAGIKGKISDGWSVGTPCVTTPIGSEGMKIPGLPWGGLIASNATEFAEQAAHLMTDEGDWLASQKAGFELLSRLFHFTSQKQKFLARLMELRNHLGESRQRNFIGAMLNHHQHQSTRYLSKWIELKNLPSRLPL